MKRTEIRWTVLIASLAAFCRADTPGNETIPANNPYDTIAERNPFGLKPPPPPAPAPQPATDQAKTDLKLTGITSFGSVKAYFSATDPKSKTPEYFSLGVDEKKDGIEVLAIDDTAKNVRIRSSGVETLMTFATHGVAPPTTPPPAAPSPGVPGVPGAVPGRGANVLPVTAGTAPGTPANAGIYTLPSRTPRVQMDPNLATRYGLGGAPVSNLSAQPAPRNTLSSEEQAILMEVRRIANPSLPPTPGMPTDSPPGIPAPVVPVPGYPRSPRLPGQF